MRATASEQATPDRDCPSTATAPVTPDRGRSRHARAARRRGRAAARGARRLDACSRPALIVILGVMVGYPAVSWSSSPSPDYGVKNKVLGTLPDFVGFDNYVERLHRPGLPERAGALRSLGLMVVMTV